MRSFTKINILRVRRQEKTRHSGFNRALTNSIVLRAKRIEIRGITRLSLHRFARLWRPLQQKQWPPTCQELPDWELDP
jgi:hypothetical protein